jgi:hypothetical protein
VRELRRPVAAFFLLPTLLIGNQYGFVVVLESDVTVIENGSESAAGLHAGIFGSEERVLEALRMLVSLAERSARSVA